MGVLTDRPVAFGNPKLSWQDRRRANAGEMSGNNDRRTFERSFVHEISSEKTLSEVLRVRQWETPQTEESSSEISEMVMVFTRRWVASGRARRQMPMGPGFSAQEQNVYQLWFLPCPIEPEPHCRPPMRVSCSRLRRIQKEANPFRSDIYSIPPSTIRKGSASSA
jgi:hypothetical protein